jgi:hypothetical protein
MNNMIDMDDMDNIHILVQILLTLLSNAPPLWCYRAQAVRDPLILIGKSSSVEANIL